MEPSKSNIKFSRSLSNESSELKLYPMKDEFIGVLHLKKSLSKVKALKSETIIILDRSGSMGENVEYIVQIILPAFFEKLSYKSDEIIHLITFDSRCEYFNLCVKEFANLGISCQGCTSMVPAVEELHKLMKKLIKDDVEAIRILTISDGEIDDQQNTAQLSNNLASFLKNSKILINSQAVRFFTSTYGQPDTTALCCLLQLNNVTSSNLLDIVSNEKIDVIVDKWAKLYDNDGLISAVELQCDSEVLRRNPWDKFSSDKLKLVIGNNIFWVNAVPGIVKINDVEIGISIEPPMSYEKFIAILNKKIDFFVDQIKILKIVDTKGKKLF